MAEEKPFVEVLYALPAEQRIVRVPFVDGMTVGDAVERSGLIQTFPELRARELSLGVFGVAAEPGTRLLAGQRVEICRPLRIDPRDARRMLARLGRTMGRAADSES